MPVDFLVTCGQVNECTKAIELLGESKAEWVLADEGYDSQTILKHIEEMVAVAFVPSKSNRKQQRTHDKELYRKRNRIERWLRQTQTLCRFATLQTTQKELQSPCRSRMFLAAPRTICRYCLESSLEQLSQEWTLCCDLSVVIETIAL